MNVKKSKPFNNSSRWRVIVKENLVDYSVKYKKQLSKYYKRSLSISYGKRVGRKIGKAQRRYIVIDFKRKKYDIFATVEAFHYDANRSCNIALLKYDDGTFKYIIKPSNLNIGDRVISSKNKVENKIGNACPIFLLPVDCLVHCIEINPGEGAKMIRSAGSYAKILSKDTKFVVVKLSSGEIKKINALCFATIGRVGNEFHNLERLGKAGRKRWKGWKSRVRPIAMGANDHPLGGGEGRSSKGRQPVTKNGLVKGVKTRKRTKKTNVFILFDRKGVEKK